jgi:hypothetical protein
VGNLQFRFSPAQHARVFLSLLVPNANATPFHFRTFDDLKSRKLGHLSQNFLGRLELCEADLRKHNAGGAGVFVVINEGGQSDAEITQVRAVMADTDGAPLEPIVDALTPHIVVSSSPGNWHVYWLVDHDFPLDCFRPVQKAIAKKFGTDPVICNPSRVMRIPGFAHRKGVPYDVHLMEARPKLPRYSHAEIVAGLRLYEDADVSRIGPVSTAEQRSQAPIVSTEASCRVEHMLRHISPWSEYSGWRDVIFAIADEFGQGGRDLAVRWSRGDLWLDPTFRGAGK